MLSPRWKGLLARWFAGAGYALLWSALWVLPVHAESLEQAIEAYEFKEYQDAVQWLRP